MIYKDIPKRTRNAVEHALKKLSKKYGFEETRMVTNRFLEDIRKKASLQREIDEKKQDLILLESKARDK